jgi:alpha-tubulin suppressor-like RCC1 family protein
MAPRSCGATLDDLPLEVRTHVCRHLGLRDLVLLSQSCKRFRHGGLQTVELPTESPVVAVLRELAFPRLKLVPRTRPVGCSKSWVAYLARCARQRRCREAPPIRGEECSSLFVDAAGRLLSCGEGVESGHDDSISCGPTLVAAMAGVRVQSVAAAFNHSLALGWNGRVYSWGENEFGQLGHGDNLARPLPALVEGLEDLRDVGAALLCSLAVTQSRCVFHWGGALGFKSESSLRRTVVEGFGGVYVRRVCAGSSVAFGIGKDGELFSWGDGEGLSLGHGDTHRQPSPKRVEALRGVRVTSAAVGSSHALALAEDGLVYAWGDNEGGFILGNPNVETEPLPKPVEALRDVRVSSIAARGNRSYAVADTGELWAWGVERENFALLGHGDGRHGSLPKPIESLRGVKVDAVAAGIRHTLALADDGSVYAWADRFAAQAGALGRGTSVSDAGVRVPMPQRVPARLEACGL